MVDIGVQKSGGRIGGQVRIGLCPPRISSSLLDLGPEPNIPTGPKRVSGKYWNSKGEEVETWQEAEE
ncbi:hypothetical protein CMK17_20220 [Candidatus Poribacteria bacterium]|nr:hypothetical protein [Candidatus Poribacteria bacterium]